MGDNLYWMITITDRNQSQKFLSFYKTYGIEVVLSTLGKGTAASEILNDFGLEATQKAVLLSVVTGKVWSAVQKGLQTIMLIDIPGTGIAFTMLATCALARVLPRLREVAGLAAAEIRSGWSLHLCFY